MPHPTTKLGAQYAFWTLKRTAVTKRRQRRLGGRRCATKWLQHPDMKHIMYPSVVRKLQAVGDLANALDHLERARILGVELATTARDKGLRVTVKQTQQHPVSDGELQSAMVSVVEAASILLRLKEPAAHFLQEFIAVAQEGVHSISVGLPRNIRQQVRRRATVNHLERRRLECRMISSIVAKLQVSPCAPVATALRRARRPESVSNSRRSSSKSRKVGTERAEEHTAAASAIAANSGASPSRRDRASATMLDRPGRNSTLKSYPNSLLIQ
jgi:hypothetical protein